MGRLFLFLTILSSMLFATKIKSINFTGLNQLSPLSAMEIANLKVGDEIDDERINRAILKLFSQGYFNNAYVEENNGDLTIHLSEKPIIAKLDIDGVASNDRDHMEKIVGIDQGQFYDDFAVSLARDSIKNYYQQKSYFDTTSEFKTTALDDKNSSIRVNVIVNRGENVLIKKLNFLGRKVFSFSRLESNLANKQRELFGWMIGFHDGKLKPFELAKDIEAIKEEYRKKGYLDVNVSTPYLNVYRDNYTAELTYYIDEGARYKVESIDIKAPAFLELDKKKIISKFRLKKGNWANIQRLRQDINTLSFIVADKGYAYAQVTPHISPVAGKNRVEILYEVEPGEKIYIRDITVIGNEKTKDRVVRREFYLTEGELYNKTNLTDSINALKRTGYFEDVEVEEKPVSNTQMDLIARIKEAPTGSITGGIGYGSSDGFLISAGVSERNIFGSGMIGDLTVDRSKQRLNGSIGLTNPRVFDSEYSLSGRVYAQKYDWRDYEVNSYGGRVTVGRKLGRVTNGYISYLYEKSDVKGVDAFYKAAGYRNGKNTKHSIVPRIVYNTTDDYLMPRSGMIVDGSFTYNGLGGSIQYSQADLGFKWFFGLREYIDWDFIFRYRADFGYIFNEDSSKLPTNEKLFLGGLDTIRGYEGRSVPKKLYCLGRAGCKYVDVGGKQSFNNSFELSIPIIDRIKLRGIAYYDYGMIGEKSFTEEKRSSLGAGIEWITPVGMLKFYWSKPLNYKEYDDINRFEFTIGQTF